MPKKTENSQRSTEMDELPETVPAELGLGEKKAGIYEIILWIVCIGDMMYGCMLLEPYIYAEFEHALQVESQDQNEPVLERGMVAYL